MCSKLEPLDSFLSGIARGGQTLRKSGWLGLAQMLPFVFEVDWDFRIFKCAESIGLPQEVELQELTDLKRHGSAMILDMNTLSLVTETEGESWSLSFRLTRNNTAR